ncbi:protein PXR1-like isoform X1 [Lytechinus variegatus]|uniref:protein PXR1-like isoform X1 n=1 Tax=Lytechinus variegatus TaxID=7654 RepID=UPI001BB2771C|nr:protein PXR1-like isoform X1 [Lytechinus variegatus]
MEKRKKKDKKKKKEKEKKKKKQKEKKKKKQKQKSKQSNNRQDNRMLANAKYIMCPPITGSSQECWCHKKPPQRIFHCFGRSNGK